jgi:N-methylhydantoinase B
MPIIPVAGSERFATSPRTSAELRESVQGVRLHDVPAAAVAGLDPLTYEVVRHRLTAITEEMGDALKRMSGSVVVTDCNDFGTAIFDEGGDSVQVGLVNTQLAASLDMAVKWTLQNRAANPGIGPGDMFFCNDPWVGGGLHQNDASIFAPLFYDGEMFAWTGAVCHQVDLGGVSPGSWSVEGRDVFWESTPVPPVKMVEAGTLRTDIEDLYLRRSRVPKLIALDLRAKIGANHVAQDRLTRLIDKYGPTAVKAVMRHMMNDAEARLRAKLRTLPDGTWSAVGHQDGARSGDRAIYKIVCQMTKRDDRLTFDFTGTDPQVEGFANCTFAGLRGGIMPIVLTMLCGDIPWAPGGLLRCLDIISEPGTINNCTFPAGIGKGSVASAWATQNAVSECVAEMLATDPEHSKSLMSVGCGTWDLALLAGVGAHRDAPLVRRRARLDAARPALFMSQTDLGDRALGEPSALPGWTRRHVLAHVAAYADALGNLVRWAATGEPAPMHASPADRAAGIERGRQLPGGGEAVTLAGPLAEITAYLTGRPNHLTTVDDGAAPILPRWL